MVWVFWYASYVVVCGGVAANQYLRKQLNELCHDLNVDVVYPSPKYCTDNGFIEKAFWLRVDNKQVKIDKTLEPTVKLEC